MPLTGCREAWLVARVQSPPRVQYPQLTDQTPPPDWYPDPHGPASLERYWDGAKWSKKVRAVQEEGFVAQLRSLPLWVKLVIPAFMAAAIVGSQPGGSPGSVKSDQLAATAFEKYELRTGATGPLHLVECKPSLETYLCSGVEYTGKDAPLSRNLSATVEPNGSVTDLTLSDLRP